MTDALSYLELQDEIENEAQIAISLNCELNKKLKEQEAVEPVPLSNRRYACGNCGNSLCVSGQRFCASCGKQVKWNE